MRTIDFLDLLKRHFGVTSDYAIAKRLDVTPQAVSKYRKGTALPDDSTAVKWAILLNMDPLFVLASINAEREKNPAVREQWERLAENADRRQKKEPEQEGIRLDDQPPPPDMDRRRSRKYILCQMLEDARNRRRDDPQPDPGPWRFMPRFRPAYARL